MGIWLKFLLTLDQFTQAGRKQSIKSQSKGLGLQLAGLQPEGEVGQATWWLKAAALKYKAFQGVASFDN